MKRTFLFNRVNIFILFFTFLCFGSTLSGESGMIPERKTYLPEYRMQQLFPGTVQGGMPWYDMNPFPSGKNAFVERKRILPVDYRESRGEYLMGSFSEFFYFTIRFSEEDILEIEQQDRENLKYLSVLCPCTTERCRSCLAGSSTEILP